MCICVDFDGVLADTAVLKRRWISFATGHQISGLVDRSTLLPLIGEMSYLAMQTEVGYEDTLLAPPMPGALSALKQLAKTAAIVVVSARPPRKMIWLNRWVALHGFKEAIRETVSACDRGKSDVVRQYGAEWLIDDDMRHAKGLPGNATFVLFGRKCVGVPFAENWTSVERLIAARDGGGFSCP